MIVKLTAKNDWQKCAWYFRKAKDCNKFMNAFENYGIRIIWNEPIIAEDFPEMDDEDYDDLFRKPKKRAKKELDWAFNSYLKDNPECDISAQIADKIIAELYNSPFSVK